MDYLIEDLYNSISLESGVVSQNLTEESKLKNGIKEIAHSIFDISEDQQVDLDTFFIGLADTPMLSGIQGQKKHHNIFKNDNSTSFSSSEPNNIVTTIAELGNKINLKEKKLVEDLVDSGMDKKIVTKLDLDISFDAGFKQTFQYCADTGNNTLETLISQLSQNNSKLQVDIKDDHIRRILNEAAKMDNQSLQSAKSLEALLSLPTIVQECNEDGLYQEALFLQQVYVNNMHRFKSYLITRANSNSFGVELLDSIRQHMNNVIKNDMVDSLEETISKSDDFVTLKRVVDTMVRINQDDLKSLESFINARTKKLEGHFNDNIGEMNVIEKIDYFRTELFNIINIYHLTFGSNDSMRNLPSECFVKEYLIPLKVAVDAESQTQMPQFTNVIMMKMLKDFLNLLLKKEELTSKQADKNCLLQLIYCAYRLKESNENYFNILLNRLVETEIYSEEEILQAIKKRKELSRMFSL